MLLTYSGILLMQVSAIFMCMPPIYGPHGVEEGSNYNFPFVTRKQWHARHARKTHRVKQHVPYVIIHHSVKPAACNSRARCSAAMRNMQNSHMDGKHLWDISYNFGVGSDGAAYEGRGWGIQGAHTMQYNNRSVGICLIGDWSMKTPPRRQLEVTKKLIASGVRRGWISPNYKLITHEQVSATDCPGDALINEIQNWPHYSPVPWALKDIGLDHSSSSSSSSSDDDTSEFEEMAN